MGVTVLADTAECTVKSTGCQPTWPDPAGQKPDIFLCLSCCRSLSDRTGQGNGAQGRNRTTDTVIFSHVLYQLSYLGDRPRKAAG